MKKFDSFTLKIITIITMLMDHLYRYSGQIHTDIPLFFGYLGKLATPLFIFLLVEGHFQTSNRFKYLTRLIIFSALMIVLESILKIGDNIFLSLTLSVVIMMMIDNIRFIKSNIIATLSFFILIISSAIYLCTNASYYGLAITLIFYLCRDYNLLMALCYLLLSIQPIFPALSTKDILNQLFIHNIQWMMIFAIIPILMYNGKQGLKNKFTKYLFYVFYPVHLIVIVLINLI